MTKRKLLHALAILTIAFFAAQSRWLAAQSVPAGGSRDVQSLLYLRHAPFLPTTLTAVTPQTTGSQPAADALVPAQKKVYNFRSIDFPGANYSDAWDFDDGAVVGTMDSPGVTQGFYFRGNSYHMLQFSFAPITNLYGINASGQMVGRYIDQANENHGFLYDGTNFTAIDPPGSTRTDALAINDSGHIVGDYVDAESVQHGFLFNGRVFTNVDFPGAIATVAYGINTGGEIVGVYYDSAGAHGFVLKKKAYSSINFPHASDTYVFGINDAGATAGEYQDASGATHGFTHAGGVFNRVDVPGAAITSLRRIKNDGSVVGAVIDSLKEVHGVIGH